MKSCVIYKCLDNRDGECLGGGCERRVRDERYAPDEAVTDRNRLIGGDGEEVVK